MTSVSVLLFVTSKSTFINNEMSSSMPNMTQIINSKSIAYFVIKQHA